MEFFYTTLSDVKLDFFKNGRAEKAKHKTLIWSSNSLSTEQLSE